VRFVHIAGGIGRPGDELVGEVAGVRVVGVGEVGLVVAAVGVGAADGDLFDWFQAV
jgi:hypothetical protein